MWDLGTKFLKLNGKSKASIFLYLNSKTGGGDTIQRDDMGLLLYLTSFHMLLMTPKTKAGRQMHEKSQSSNAGHNSELKAPPPTPLSLLDPGILTEALRSPLISWFLNVSTYKMAKWQESLLPSRSSRKIPGRPRLPDRLSDAACVNIEF